MLSYSSHDADGVIVLSVEEAEPGGWVMTQREWLYKTIAECPDPRFVIDMRAIQYMASSDIGVLLTLKRRIDARKGKVAIANVDPFIRDLLRTMGLDKLFTITPDVADALRAVSS
jgi:anti-sigma B factor antagonist